MWYFRLIQVGLIIILLVYYAVILFEVVTGEDTTYTGHSIDDSKIWIPFYIWLNKKQKTKKSKTN